LLLWLLLLFVLLGDRAGGQHQRTADQYGYEFFHRVSFVGFLCYLFKSLHVTKRLLVRGCGYPANEIRKADPFWMREELE
jgi:hypothetical protein